MPLLTRRTFPPGGWVYFQPQTNWPQNPTAYFDGKTFEQVCQEIAAHRAANPRFGLSTDLAVIGDELDLFTCVRIRHDPNYCTGGASLKALRPLPLPPAAGPAAEGGLKGAVAKLHKLSQGVGTLLEWLGSGGQVVDQRKADERGAICVACPQNQPGGIETIFTAPAAEKIRRHLALKNDMALKTVHDEKLQICQACLCVTSLKCWVPIAHVVKKLTPEMRAQLHASCWILSESAIIPPVSKFPDPLP